MRRLEDAIDARPKAGALSGLAGSTRWPGVTYAAGLDFSDSDRGQMDRCNLTVVDWRHGRIVRLDTAQASDATSLTRRAD